MNFKQVASLLHISESSVIRIFDKYCNIPRIPLPEVLCIDEIYTKHTDSNSPYSCVFSDFFNLRFHINHKLCNSQVLTF